MCLALTSLANAQMKSHAELKQLFEQALDLQSRGEPQRAYDLLIGIPEETIAPDAVTQLAYWNNRAAAELETGRYTDSQQHYRKALMILKADSAPDTNPVAMIVLANLATALLGTGQYDAAAEMQSRVMEARRARREAVEPEEGRLASILARTGRLEEAQKLSSRACDWLRRHPEHPQREELAAHLLTLAGIQMQTDQYEEASQNALSAERLVAQEAGRRAIPMIAVKQIRAQIAARQNRWAEAARHYQDALAIAEDKLPTHSALRLMLINYAEVLMQLKDKRAAKAALARADRIAPDPLHEMMLRHTLDARTVNAPDRH